MLKRKIAGPAGGNVATCRETSNWPEGRGATTSAVTPQNKKRRFNPAYNPEF